MSEKKTTGILLIGIGDPFYTNLAYNLALSLKQGDIQIPIQLLTDDPSLPCLLDNQKKVFDIITKVDEDNYLDQYRMNPFMLKTRIYGLSEFDNTLFLDADQLFLNARSLKSLFDTLNESDFQIHEVRRYTKAQAHESGMIWTQVKDGQQFPALWERYKIADDAELPEYNSSFIWFKKTKENKKYFEKVAKNYFIRTDFQPIGVFYPDEMAWNVTSAQLRHYSAKKEWKPCFLNWEATLPTLEAIEKQYYFLNMASGYQPSKQITWYDNLTKMVRSGANDNVPFRFDMRKKIFFQKT